MEESRPAVGAERVGLCSYPFASSLIVNTGDSENIRISGGRGFKMEG